MSWRRCAPVVALVSSCVASNAEAAPPVQGPQPVEVVNEYLPVITTVQPLEVMGPGGDRVQVESALPMPFARKLFFDGWPLSDDGFWCTTDVNPPLGALDPAFRFQIDMVSARVDVPAGTVAFLEVRSDVETPGPSQVDTVRWHMPWLSTPFGVSDVWIANEMVSIPAHDRLCVLLDFEPNGQGFARVAITLSGTNEILF